MNKNPLGRTSAYPDTYNPDLLHAVSRQEGRATLGLDAGNKLPFGGCDLWTAWELGWLNAAGVPAAGVLHLSVPAASPRLVESKSLKLYLNSFSMSSYKKPRQLAQQIEADLTRATGSPVGVTLVPAAQKSTGRIRKLPGRCIDYEDSRCTIYEVEPALLQHGEETVSESLHSHVLRSLCPVTGQPDSGSILITYEGPRIDRASLLAYLVSYRRHSDFHEACVERIFCDLRARCGVEQLTVYARYNRRGGIDINPFRSSFEERPEPYRLWRQ